MYILLVKKNKKKALIHYVGYTNNLKKRLNKHNSSKGAKFTKGRYWKLAYSKRYKSKNIALKEEYKLKVNYKLRNQIKKKFIKNENISSLLPYKENFQKIMLVQFQFLLKILFKIVNFLKHHYVLEICHTKKPF